MISLKTNCDNAWVDMVIQTPITSHTPLFCGRSNIYIMIISDNIQLARKGIVCKRLSWTEIQPYFQLHFGRSLINIRLVPVCLLFARSYFTRQIHRNFTAVPERLRNGIIAYVYCKMSTILLRSQCASTLPCLLNPPINTTIWITLHKRSHAFVNINRTDI